MKRGNKLFALLLVLALVVGATCAVTFLKPEDSGAEEEPAATVFTLDADTVTYISWNYYEPVSFEKQDGQWVYTEDSAFPLNSTYIDTMLNTLREVTAYKTIEAVEDWDQYTLEEPYCQIGLTAGGVDYILKIGAESALGGQRYFSTGDGNAYLVDAAVLDAFSYKLYDLLTPETIPDMSAAVQMQVESVARSYAVAYRDGSGKVYSDEYVWFMEDKVLDTELTQELLAAVTSLSWTECVDFHAQDPAAYGLDLPDAVITVKYPQTAQISTGETDGTGNAVTETVESEESFVLEIGAKTGDYRYARIAGSDMVYIVPAAGMERLMYATYYELQPDEVLLMDWSAVTGVDIVLDGVCYTFAKETVVVTDEAGNTSEKTVYTRNGEEIGLETVTGILDGMGSSGNAAGVTAESAEQIRITIYRDQDAFPAVELAFYPYDSTQCLRVLEGMPAVFVSREDVVNLMEAVNSIVMDP